MTTKDLIIQELEHIPEPLLVEILDVVQTLKAQRSDQIRQDVWDAYLASKQEREEVYRRLADS
jgi:hypothetical protein